MYYIDSKGRLIYETHSLKANINGVEETLILGRVQLLFTFELLWE